MVVDYSEVLFPEEKLSIGGMDIGSDVKTVKRLGEYSIEVVELWIETKSEERAKELRNLYFKKSVEVMNRDSDLYMDCRVKEYDWDSQDEMGRYKIRLLLGELSEVKQR